ncbi:MAG: MBL fold metallo-hydrolase [Syntrophales bacterium]|nr:MBL fold metallo-hydrolase [Syntrophales bacterium]
MIIRCWGARGSVAVSGREYLKYGGDTTCLEVRTKNDEVIIIDAGTGIRRLGNQLFDENHDTFHMLLTHVHWDHIMGFPFFKPLYDRNRRIIFHGSPLPNHSIEKVLASLMRDPLFPVDYGIIKGRLQYDDLHRDSFTIDSVTVTPIPLSHPNQGTGFLFSEGEVAFVFLTDNELTYRHPGGLDFEEYRSICAGADLLIHDAEFKAGEYEQARRWGHSVFTDALNLALGARVASLGLFHHNQDRTDEALDRMVEECRSRVERDGVSMDCFALPQDWEIVLEDGTVAGSMARPMMI